MSIPLPHLEARLPYTICNFNLQILHVQSLTTCAKGFSPPHSPETPESWRDPTFILLFVTLFHTSIYDSLWVPLQPLPELLKAREQSNQVV